jgi:hypothetical protein
MISGYVDTKNSSVTFYSLNDNLIDYRSQIIYELRNWTDGSIFDTQEVAYLSLGQSNQFVKSITISEVVGKFCPSLSDCFLHVYGISGCATFSTSIIAFTPFKNISLPNPNITISFLDSIPSTSSTTSSKKLSQVYPLPDSKLDECSSYKTHPDAKRMHTMSTSSKSTSPNLVASIEFTISAIAPAIYAFIESPIPGKFSDNALTLMPNKEIIITFTGYDLFDPIEFQQTYQVRSIYDTYNRPN